MLTCYVVAMTTKKANKVKKKTLTAGPAVPLAARVAKSRAALVKRGGSKIPGGWLQPEPAMALKFLHAHGYAPTRVGCIARALDEAADRERKRAGKGRQKT